MPLNMRFMMVHCHREFSMVRCLVIIVIRARPSNIRGLTRNVRALTSPFTSTNFFARYTNPVDSALRQTILWQRCTVLIQVPQQQGELLCRPFTRSRHASGLTTRPKKRQHSTLV